jgi:hypothetical protein
VNKFAADLLDGFAKRSVEHMRVGRMRKVGTDRLGAQKLRRKRAQLDRLVVSNDHRAADVDRVMVIHNTELAMATQRSQSTTATCSATDNAIAPLAGGDRAVEREKSQSAITDPATGLTTGRAKGNDKRLRHCSIDPSPTVTAVA